MCRTANRAFVALQRRNCTMLLPVRTAWSGNVLRPAQLDKDGLSDMKKHINTLQQQSRKVQFRIDGLESYAALLADAAAFVLGLW